MRASPMRCNGTDLAESRQYPDAAPDKVEQQRPRTAGLQRYPVPAGQRHQNGGGEQAEKENRVENHDREPAVIFCFHIIGNLETMYD